jgi:seryl-tRNA synthetase
MLLSNAFSNEATTLRVTERQLKDGSAASTTIAAANPFMEEARTLTTELEAARRELEALRKERDALLRESVEYEWRLLPAARSHTVQLEQEVKRLNDKNHQLAVALTAIVGAKGAMAEAMQANVLHKDVPVLMPRLVYTRDADRRKDRLVEDEASSLSSDGCASHSMGACGVIHWDCVLA